MNKVRVSKAQFDAIRSICRLWNSNDRWLPALDQFLWQSDIRPTADASPEWPSGYQFLAGGVDHIDYGPRYITVHDRCLAGVDGTTRFWK